MVKQKIYVILTAFCFIMIGIFINAIYNKFQDKNIDKIPINKSCIIISQKIHCFVDGKPVNVKDYQKKIGANIDGILGHETVEKTIKYNEKK
jgi:hypothetical protein